MQMVGFPEKIEYYPDEESYFEDQTKTQKGKKISLHEGTVFASGFFQNRSPNSEYFESDEHLDDIVSICGPVKALYKGYTQFGENKNFSFITCIIDTEFGPLQIDHTVHQVEKSQISNLKVGSYVSFIGILSGDAAIYDYEKGIVRDEEHDLAALRYMFSGNDPERIRSILSNDAVYHTEYHGEDFCGPDAIIQRLKEVQEVHQEKNKYFAHLATIVSVDEGEYVLPYAAGKRCIILAMGEETKYTTIVFIDTDENGNIERMTTSSNSRYHFQIDQKPKARNPFEGLELPKTVLKPILLRAKFQGIIDQSVTEEMLSTSSDYSYEFDNNISQILESIPEENLEEKKRIIKNVFGYLFAKAIELHYAKTRPVTSFEERLLCSYSIDDAWEGVIHSDLSAEQNTRLEEALELGKQFYNDFEFFQGTQEESSYKENLRQALVAVQILGTMYSIL